MGIALSILFFVVILVVLFRMQATLVEIQDRQKAAMRLTHQRLETIEKLFWRKREAEEPEERTNALLQLEVLGGLVDNSKLPWVKSKVS